MYFLLSKEVGPFVARMSHPTGRSIFRFLIAVAVAVIGAAALTIALTIWWLRSEAIAGAFKDSSNLAEVLAGQTASSIQSIDLILTEIKAEEEFRSAQMPDDFEHVGRSENTFQYLIGRLSRLPQAAFITLVDNKGKIANTTLQWPAPEVDLSDRPYFQHFSNTDDNRVYISNALVGRMGGTQFVAFASASTAPTTHSSAWSWSVSGSAISKKSMNPSHRCPINRLAYCTATAPSSCVTPIRNRDYEKIPADSPWYRLVAARWGNYRYPSHYVGVGRLVAVRPLRDYPLVVNVGVSETAALAAWRVQAIAIGIGTLLFVACSLFLLRALSRQFHSLERSELALVKKTDELKRAKATVDAALNNLVQGVVMFDAKLRLIVCNQRYLDMYRLSTPEIVRPGVALKKSLTIEPQSASSAPMKSSGMSMKSWPQWSQRKAIQQNRAIA